MLRRAMVTRGGLLGQRRTLASFGGVSWNLSGRGGANAWLGRMKSTLGATAHSTEEPESWSRSGRCCFSLLGNRTVLEVNGPDAAHFLQGIMTNDVNILGEEESSMYTGFLNNKGRMLAEAIVHRMAEDVYFLDVHVDVAPRMMKLLKMFKLRSNVELNDSAGVYNVVAVMGSQPTEEVHDDLDEMPAASVAVDPRVPALGHRIICGSKHAEGSIEFLQDLGLEHVKTSVYEKWRLFHGVPEGKEVDGAIPLEFNLDKLNGVSFSKGCYTGQELIARVHFQGLVRKRLAPLTIGEHVVQERGLFKNKKVGGAPQGLKIPADATIENADGSKAGKLITFNSEVSMGLGLLRLSDQGIEEQWTKDGVFEIDSHVAQVPELPIWWGKVSEEG